MRQCAGTTGYAAAAKMLAQQYEAVTFEEIHREALHLYPTPPSLVLDIGAGTGRDAAALSRLGHTVVAVEPTTEMRITGQHIHRATQIEWIDDALPELSKVRRSGRYFDLILLMAVWMHIEEHERRLAMKNITSILAPGGRIALSLRRGPAPAKRRMFAVAPDETITLAQDFGLRVLQRSDQHDALNRPAVDWTLVVMG